MPWKETCPVDERLKFCELAMRGELSMTALCEAYGISRQKGYKWLERFKAEGKAGLVDRSRAPLRRPHAISEDVADVLTAIREAHPLWGPRTILAWLKENEPKIERPAASSVGDLFKKRGLVKSRRRRSRFREATTQPFADVRDANDTWCTDFKGQFTVGSGELCYPLTITDAHSRFLLCCHGLPDASSAPVIAVFERVFREYGLPNVVHSDNGCPFGSAQSPGGLSVLSIYLIKLGIRPEFSRPASPQDNGRHERMHRTLKQHTALPPRSGWTEQQDAFDAFRGEYNYERPHQALEFKTPASLYRESKRRYPEYLPELAYPTSFLVRQVRGDGHIKWRGGMVFVSEILRNEAVGLLEQEDGSHELYCGPASLGWLSPQGAFVPRRKFAWAPEIARSPDSAGAAPPLPRCSSPQAPPTAAQPGPGAQLSPMSPV